MKKFVLLVLSMSFMTVTLLGCQAKDNAAINTDTDTDTTEREPTKQALSEQQPGENEVLVLDGEIKKVSISTSKGNNATIFDDDFSIEILKSVFSSAIKENGIVNMANPEFYVDIVYENENKQSFHLWLGGKFEESTLMKTDDTHTIYILPEESTNKIMDLME
ncbi:hypothetical protein [Sporosarcina beigongshangi]|uniref:hypothetical protein n=1 Tax=Sporosarcina beigongshangi TaxID=2782538 RepID=UPI00193AD548|nr:hypothetical protein [Sporosarcina beigongshangi]